MSSIEVKSGYYNPEEHEGQLALMIAIGENGFPKMKRLMENGLVTDFDYICKFVPPTSEDPNIYEASPLMLAVRVFHENPEIVSYLLEHGGNPNMPVLWETPLMRACYRPLRQFQLIGNDNENYNHTDKLEVVKILLSFGALVNDIDYNGWTALHYAASGVPMKEIPHILIQRGVDPHIRNSDDETARDLVMKTISDVPSERMTDGSIQKIVFLQALDSAIQQRQQQIANILFPILAFLPSEIIPTIVYFVL